MYHLAFLLLVASASACTIVPGCECWLSDGGLRYNCKVGDDITFSLESVFNSDIFIYCSSGNFSSDVMPAVALSSGGALSRVSLTSCDVPVLSHLLARVGAKGVDKLELTNLKGTLEARHLQGLAGIRSILIFDDWSLNEDTVIQNLDLGVFSNLKDLTELEVSGNRIMEIKPGDFDGLSSLQYLDLSQNQLTYLSAGALRGAGRLTRLRLASTRLRVIRTGALADAPRLTEITLESNYDNLLTLETQALANLQYLKNVTIKKIYLSELPSDLFMNSTAIEMIDFTESSLGYTNVPSTLFRDQKNLKRLNLSGNHLRVVPRSLIDNLINLECLDLSENYIMELPKNTFANLTNLVKLSLNGNQLETLFKGAFTGLVRLRALDLSNNHLMIFKRDFEEGNQSPLFNLTQLRILNLNHNEIKIMFDDWRKSLYNLEFIDLSWNSIQKLMKKDMEFSQKNLEVDLRHNLINTIKISDNLRSSTALYLGDNPYNCDCELYPFLDYVQKHNTTMDLTSAVCNTPPYLKSVSLKNVATLLCPSSNCPDNCSCRLLPAASSIYLDCTTAPSFYPNPKHYNMTSIKLKLRSLKDNVPLILSPEVVSLDLSGIGLIKAPSLPKTLKEIDLRLNRLATIPRAITSLNATLYIAGNPFQCSCENKDDIELLLKKGFADRKNVDCVDGEPLISVIHSNLCKVQLTQIVVIFTIAFLFAIGVLVIFLFIYSDKVKRYIYKQGWNLFIYEEELDERKYDVLVSYGDEVEKFVVQKFVPELENRGYTVSARYKDWDIGVWIPTKVAESIDESRRIVVIPTEKYLSSVISMELEAARLAQMGQKRKRLLIVVKDEIEIEPFKELKCLRWANSSFWEKLEKELPKRRKKSEKIGSQANLNVLMTSEGKIEFARNKTR